MKCKMFIKILKNIILEFVALRPNTSSYFIDDDSEVKNAKGTKKCI